MKYILFFLSFSLYASHSPISKPLPEIRDLLRPNDREEYYCLREACKTIKRAQVTIADVRMCVDDAIETAITLYLKNVNSIAALVLLKDLQNSKFVF